MHRSLLAAVGVLAFAAACSDPTTGPSSISPRFQDGASTDVGPVEVSLYSGVDATLFCGKTLDDTWSIVPIPCAPGAVAPVTTVNPGWTGDIPGSSWISWISNGDAYVSPPASYTYRQQFEVPADATSLVLNVKMLADNGVAVYLNGTKIGETSVNQNIFAVPQDYSSVTQSDFILGATNYLYFVVENTRVPTSEAPGALPTAIGQPCPARPHATSTTGGPFYDAGDYDAVACYNPTGLRYQATVSWVIPEIPGGQGCSPGYWKNHAFPEGYTKNTLFSSVFDNAFPGLTLQQVLSLNGGGLNALGRQTVSALLNAAAAGVDYEYTTAEVIAAFNAAYPGSDYTTLKNTFEALTDVDGRICPLN